MFLSYSFNLPFVLVWFSVPGAPPRKVEVEAINSTAIRVTWKPPLQGKQHGQIRGYQVVFSRLENGEPRGQPNIMDVFLPEAQVLHDVLLLPGLSALLPHCLYLFYAHLPLFSFPTASLFSSIVWVHTSFPPYWVTQLEFPSSPLFFFVIYLHMWHLTLNWYPAPTALD